MGCTGAASFNGDPGIPAVLVTGVFVYLFTSHIPRESENIRTTLKSEMSSQKSDINSQFSAQLNPLVTQLAVLNARFELLSPNASKQLGNVLKEKTKGTGSEVRINFETAKQLASLATDQKITASRSEVGQAGAALLNVKSDDPALATTAWGTALELARYISYLNASKVDPAVKVAVSRAIAEGVKPPIVGLIVSRNQGDGEVTLWGFDRLYNLLLSERFTPVPAGVAAVFAPIGADAAQNPKSSPAYIIVRGSPALHIPLDEIRCRNVIFKNCTILYKGGPLQLENVEFVDCSFEILRNVNGIRLADGIFQSQVLKLNLS